MKEISELEDGSVEIGRKSTVRQKDDKGKKRT